jgi:uncharacterized protein with FMN-binding domain
MVTPMRRRVTTVMTVCTGVVLVLSLRASAQGHSASAAAPAGVVETPRSATPSSAPAPAKSHRSAAKPHRLRAKSATPKATPKATPTATSPRAITVNGAITDTMYGPVQVQVTVRGNRIVRANAIDYPQGGGRDQEINSQAIPQLNQETVQAQSAQIDTVSGATYTSEGYRASLQSALDAAHKAA